MQKMTIRNSRVALLMVLGAVGCPPPFAVKTPSGFVELENSYLPYKAVASDGAVLAVRTWDNKPKASRKFWAEVIHAEMTEQRGYKLKKRGAVSAKGAAGTLHHYSCERQGEPFFYVLALFVTSDDIMVVEATAPEKDYPKHKRAIDAFVASFETK